MTEDDPRYRLPAGFKQALAPIGEDGASTYLLTGKSGIPVLELAAVAERMGGIALAENSDSDLLVTFAPYEPHHRVQWCMNVKALARHHGVDWPHLALVEG